MNTTEQKPFLAIDYKLLSFEVKDKSGKVVDSLKHKLIYSYLSSLSRTFNEVHPRMDSIGDILGIGSRQVVMRCLKSLEEWGWIECNKRKGTSNTYLVNPVEDILSNIARPLKVALKPEVFKKIHSNQRQQEQNQLQSSLDVFDPFDDEVDEESDTSDFLAELEAYDALQSSGKPIVKPKLQPWGSCATFKGNGCVNDEAWQWALTNSNGTEGDALKVLSKQTGLKIERDQIQSYSQLIDEEYILPF